MSKGDINVLINKPQFNITVNQSVQFVLEIQNIYKYLNAEAIFKICHFIHQHCKVPRFKWLYRTCSQNYDQLYM